jgi:regulator of PEP synthase PpsR (kinase-PPPase family)
MQILINSDHHIKGGDSATETVESIVRAAVERFANRITRIEVHLSDTNGPKHGDKEKRCVLEARVGGLRPLAVAHEAPNLREAVEGAAEKLHHSLEQALARLEELPGGTPREGEIASVDELQALEKDKRQ